MYCKKCGKLISEDSVFCKYCGSQQEEELAPANIHRGKSRTEECHTQERKQPSIFLWFHKLSKFNKGFIVVYFFWFFIQLALLFAGHGCNDWYPDFDHNIFDGRAWEVWDYGMPEFIVYTIIVPAIIYLTFYFKDRIRKAISDF